MDMLWMSSVSGFAFVSSISPGPVNLLTLSNTVRGDVRGSFSFISGATLGFAAQLLLLGLLVQPLFTALPWLAQGLQWGGVAFFLWMAWLLWHAGDAGDAMTAKSVGFAFGMLLQWLNPKAYLAIAVAVGLYVGHDTGRLFVLCAIYMLVCWLSLAAWIALGVFLRRHVASPRWMVSLNRVLAVLLLASVAVLWR